MSSGMVVYSVPQLQSSDNGAVFRSNIHDVRGLAMLRSIAAGFVAYLVMVVLTVVATIVQSYAVFGKLPDPATHVQLSFSYGIINRACATIFAALAGWVCANLAKNRQIRHALFLAAVIFTISLLSLGLNLGKQPLWYQLSFVFLGAPAALLGARVKARASAA
jgi:hypothetical protein